MSLLLLLLATATHAFAQQAQPVLEGRFVQRDQAADQRSIDTGIERVAQAFPALLRPLVRPYLAGVTGHCAQPDFAWEGPVLVYSCGDDELLRRVPDGAPFTWLPPGEDESTTVVLKKLDQHRVSMSFSRELGGRTQTFELGADGIMREHLVYHSDKLPVPLEYTLEFVRAPDL
jgi:hypothetical protein